MELSLMLYNFERAADYARWRTRQLPTEMLASVGRELDIHAEVHEDLLMGREDEWTCAD